MNADSQLIIADGVKASSSGLILSDGLKESQWEEVGRKLGSIESAYQWMVGDWWNFGEKNFGNRRHLVESPTWTGPAYNTCVQYGVVCRAFEMYIRRYTLTFAHHQEITALKVSKPKLTEEILDWCEETLKNGKKKPRSVAKMKAEIKKRLNKHFEPMKRAQSKPQDFDYIEFIGPIEQFAQHNDFDLRAIAKVQVELFGDDDMLREDLEACNKVVNTINGFLKEVDNLCILRRKNG